MSRPPDPRTGASARPTVETGRRTAATLETRLGRVLAGGVLIALCAYLLTYPTVALAIAAIVAFLALFSVVPLLLLAAADTDRSLATIRATNRYADHGTAGAVTEVDS
jgi:hypothetical protein